MQLHLYKFLVLYRKLSIPSLGAFTIDDQPARMDTTTGLLFAPKPVIHFTEAAIPMPDKLFFGFLADEMEVDEATAISEFHDFCQRFRSHIQEHNVSVLAGIGRLMKGAEDKLFFTPETNLLELLPPIQCQTAVVTPNKKTANDLPTESHKKHAVTAVEETVEEMVETEETIVTTDRWWIYAIILLAAGGIALLFHYQ